MAGRLSWIKSGHDEGAFPPPLREKAAGGALRAPSFEKGMLVRVLGGLSRQ